MGIEKEWSRSVFTYWYDMKRHSSIPKLRPSRMGKKNKRRRRVVSPLDPRGVRYLIGNSIETNAGKGNDEGIWRRKKRKKHSPEAQIQEKAFAEEPKEVVIRMEGVISINETTSAFGHEPSTITLKLIPKPLSKTSPVWNPSLPPPHSVAH